MIVLVELLSYPVIYVVLAPLIAVTWLLASRKPKDGKGKGRRR